MKHLIASLLSTALFSIGSVNSMESEQPNQPVSSNSSSQEKVSSPLEAKAFPASFDWKKKTDQPMIVTLNTCQEALWGGLPKNDPTWNVPDEVKEIMAELEKVEKKDTEYETRLDRAQKATLADVLKEYLFNTPTRGEPIIEEHLSEKVTLTSDERALIDKITTNPSVVLNSEEGSTGEALLLKLQPIFAANFAAYYGASHFMKLTYNQLLENSEPSGSCCAFDGSFYDLIGPDLLRTLTIGKLITYTSINAATGLLAAYICKALPSEFGNRFPKETLELSFTKIAEDDNWKAYKALSR